MSIGIDYGRGVTNIDVQTGIRYGVISQHSILQVLADESTPDYGPPTCPKCGNEATEYEKMKDYRRVTEAWERDRGYPEYACRFCEYLFTSDSAFPDEPVRFYVDDGEYVMTSCLDSDVVITKSPYYTYAPFCSPCVPGAGDLDTAGNRWKLRPDLENFRAIGVKSYCVNHDWFDDGHAPYPVFRVSDDLEVAS